LDATREQSLIGQLLRHCTESSILDFEQHINRLLESSSIRKLGEASYSEVFLQSAPGSSSTVLKIIPFGGEDQCRLESIVQEIRITKAMGEIEGFVGFRWAYVVQGYFPQALMDEWDYYDEERGSENERPEFYEEDQMFAIICLENGGVDLEHFDLNGWEEAWEVFWQVTLALARGEKENNFEVIYLLGIDLSLHITDSVTNSTEIYIMETLLFGDYPMKTPQKTYWENYLSKTPTLSKARSEHNRD
jgi:serine/threonine-protein kinase haspin